jgi:hypothetical protein
MDQVTQTTKVESKCNHLITFEKVYIVEGGVKFIDHSDFMDIPAENFRYVFHFQTVDCANIYAISNKIEEKISLYDLYIKLITGLYDIGISYINNPTFITDIKPYTNDDCDEIHFHYTTTRINKKNIAWRSIHWDLFEKIVNILNSEDHEKA